MQQLTVTRTAKLTQPWRNMAAPNAGETSERSGESDLHSLNHWSSFKANAGETSERSGESDLHSLNHWSSFKGNAGETSERSGGAHMGFSERIDARLN